MVIDSGLVGSTDFHWEGCRESRRCSRDIYPESYITKYTSIRRYNILASSAVSVQRRFARLRQVDVRLHGKGNSNSHGARLVHLTITMVKRMRTSRLSINNSLSRHSPLGPRAVPRAARVLMVCEMAFERQVGMALVAAQDPALQPPP